MRWLPALSFVVIAIVHSERAEAVCEIGDFGPTAALPTQRVGQSFGFVATTDCRGLTFLATSVRLSKTPTPGVMLGADRQREGDGAAEVAISSGNGGAMVVYESDSLF